MAKQATAIIKQHHLVYLAMNERCGKTITSLLTVETLDVDTILVITKKKVVADWQEVIADCSWLKKKYKVTNYHSAHKMLPLSSYAVILDESHAYLSSKPKKSSYGKIWNSVKALTGLRDIVYLSATPVSETFGQLYNQLALSSFSPFRLYDNFYDFYSTYAVRTKSGNYQQIRTSSTNFVTDYSKVDKRAMDAVKHLFLFKTREELGFEQEPVDKLHYITLDPLTKKAYNILLVDNVLEAKNQTLICDTSMRLRTSLHQLESGCLKIDEKSVILKNQEKIDYIKDTWGDTTDLVIMYQYIAEGIKLNQHFKNAEILQGISYAEGIDLSHKKHLIVYSQDFSCSRHTQRRARQANKKRKEPIIVSYLLVKKGISEQVYNSVSKKKKNFVDSVFKKEQLV